MKIIYIAENKVYIWRPKHFFCANQPENTKKKTQLLSQFQCLFFFRQKRCVSEFRQLLKRMQKIIPTHFDRRHAKILLCYLICKRFVTMSH